MLEAEQIISAIMELFSLNPTQYSFEALLERLAKSLGVSHAAFIESADSRRFTIQHKNTSSTRTGFNDIACRRGSVSSTIAIYYHDDADYRDNWQDNYTQENAVKTLAIIPLRFEKGVAVIYIDSTEEHHFKRMPSELFLLYLHAWKTIFENSKMMLDFGRMTKKHARREHDIRNLLGNLHSACSTLRDEFAKHESGKPLNIASCREVVTIMKRLSAHAEKTLNADLKAQSPQLAALVQSPLFAQIQDDSASLMVSQSNQFELNEPLKILHRLNAERLATQSKKIQFTVEGIETSELAQVLGDEMELVHALSNLIRNAEKYTKSTITIGCRILENTSVQYEVEYYVRDNGPGFGGKIPDAFQTKADQDDQGGTSIGLYNVRMTAEAFNGELLFDELENAGAGAESIAGLEVKLKLTLPKALHSSKKPLTSLMCETPPPSSPAGSGELPPREQHKRLGDFKQFHILAVDDSKVMGAILRKATTTTYDNVTLTFCTSIKAFLERFLSEPMKYHCFLLDRNIDTRPDDGLELAKLVGEHLNLQRKTLEAFDQALPHPPLVMILSGNAFTAGEKPDCVHKALLKPVKPRDIIAEIKAHYDIPTTTLETTGIEAPAPQAAAPSLDAIMGSPSSSMGSMRLGSTHDEA